MDMNTLGANLIGIMRAAAPFVGMSDEVEAAERLVKSVRDAYDTVKGSFDPAQRANLEAGLDELAAKVNAHADRTKDSLG